MRYPVPASTWSTSRVDCFGPSSSSSTPLPSAAASRTWWPFSVSTTPSTRSFSHQDPFGPSTVRALVIRMSSGSRRNASGVFQNAQCQPSHSCVTGRLMWPERASWAGLGSFQLTSEPRYELYVGPGLVQQRRRLQRRLAGADHGDPATLELLQVVVVGGVRDQVGRQTRQLGGDVRVGQHAGRDDHLPGGDRLGVRERDPESAAGWLDLGRGNVADVGHQLLGEPVGVAEEPLERQRARPGPCSRARGTGSRPDIVPGLGAAISEAYGSDFRSMPWACGPPGVHRAAHDPMVNAEPAQVGGDRYPNGPAPMISTSVVDTYCSLPRRGVAGGCGFRDFRTLVAVLRNSARPGPGHAGRSSRSGGSGRIPRRRSKRAARGMLSGRPTRC